MCSISMNKFTLFIAVPYKKHLPEIMMPWQKHSLVRNLGEDGGKVHVLVDGDTQERANPACIGSRPFNSTKDPSQIS